MLRWLGLSDVEDDAKLLKNLTTRLTRDGRWALVENGKLRWVERFPLPVEEQGEAAVDGSDTPESVDSAESLGMDASPNGQPEYVPGADADMGMHDLAATTG